MKNSRSSITPADPRSARARRAALAAYFGLVLLVVVWEAWWAPATTPLPRGFWVGLKAAPLIVPLPWLLRDSAYAYVLTSLLALVYFCDGVVIAYSAAGSNAASLAFGTGEISLAVLFIVAASLYVRITFRARTSPSRAGTEP